MDNNVVMEIDTLSVASLTLEQFLSNTTDGKIILYGYNHHKTLEDNARQNLIHLVIGREFEIILAANNDILPLPHFKISKERFEYLAKEIVALFSTEGESTYYVPYKKNGSKKIYAHGKLLDHFNYFKKTLKENSMLAERKAESVLEAVVVPESYDIDSGVNSEKWLVENFEPIEEVRKAWDESYPVRLSILKGQDKEQFPYLEKYPIFKTDVNIAVQLVAEDFEKLHPQAKLNFLNQWNNLKQFLIKSFVRKKNISSTYSPDILVVLLEIHKFSIEVQDALVLHLLPSLFKCTPKKRKAADKLSTSTISSSYLETQESFAFVIGNASAIPENVERIKKNEGTSYFKPRLAFIGKFPAIEQYIVLFNEFRFEFDNPVDALVHCFALTYALDIHYNIRATNVWLLLQIAGFGITEGRLSNSTQVNALLNKYFNSLADLPNSSSANDGGSTADDTGSL